MRKLTLLVVIIMVLVAFAGCQQAGLSEAEVRNIIDQEVSNRLATIDELTVSRLSIENEKGRVVAVLGTSFSDGCGSLRLYDGDASWDSLPAVSLFVMPESGEGYLNLYNGAGSHMVSLGSLMDAGYLNLRSADGKPLVTLGNLYEGGYVTIYNGEEEIVVRVGASIMDDGRLFIHDKDGQVTFEAP